MFFPCNILLEVPSPQQKRAWQDELRELLRSFVAAKRRHPSAPEVLRAGPARSREALRLAEAGLRVSAALFAVGRHSKQQAAALDAWLQSCQASSSVELQNFVAVLQRDYAAVKAALTFPWSNGPVEGHINRLKLIKRSGYGRIQLDLLRQRVLYDAA